MTGARPARTESGESLLELLVSVTLLGLAVVSVFPAVLAAVGASRMDRESVQAQSLVRSWGEFVVARTTDTGAGAYVPCASPATYDPASPAAPSAWSYQSPLPALPTGFAATVVEVQWWNGTTFVAKDHGSGTAGACVTGTDDTGVQRLKLRVAGAGSGWVGVRADHWVAVRKPCASGC